MQSEILFYRNPAVALPGTQSGVDWAFPGNALSASCAPFRADTVSGQLDSARWFLVWNPQVSDPASPTGVRLVHCDSGPSNLVEVAAIRQQGEVYAKPRVGMVDITTVLNSLIAGKQYKQLGQQTFGNGGNGCLIYASWVELVWKPAAPAV